MRWNCIFLLIPFAGLVTVNLAENEFNSNNKERFPSLLHRCELICHNTVYDYSNWSCEWKRKESDCHFITRDIMRNAKTADPDTPYLMNVSSLSYFEIFFSNIGISDFEDGFLLDYPHLYYFKISSGPFMSNSIEMIKANMFEGVGSITKITIRRCKNLTIIEDGAFEGLTSLRILDLSHNSLTTLTNEIFKNLVSLGSLILTDNLLIDIQEEAFKDLTKLRSLWLNGNKLHSLKSQVFSNLPNLIDLKLQNNDIESLPNEIFKSRTTLEQINLTGNPLSIISSGMFNYSTKIEFITVGCIWDQISVLTIEKGGLTTRNKVKWIDVVGCLAQVEPLALEGTNTYHLSLEDNERLKAIPSNIFKGMKQLPNLYLRNNSIETINGDSFQADSFKELMVLDLSHNHVKTIQKGTLKKVTQLTNLDMSFNLITTIAPHFFEDLTLLNFLSLQSNRINQIFGNAFSSLGQLRSLNLKNNTLRNISAVSFQGLSSLKELDLSSNKIETISHGDLGTFESLDTLLLQQNRIWNVDGINDLIYILRLDLSENVLTYLNRTFMRMFIHDLTLSKNRIEKIDFKKIIVKKLLLDHNKIKDISFIRELQPSTSLDISFNNITEVNDENIKKLQSMKHFIISNNPWKCSCDQTDFYLTQFLLKHNIIPCCPKLCHSSLVANNTVYIDCSSQNESSLPSCLPYEQIRLDYSKNNLQNLSFTSYQENITHLDCHENVITWINGSSLKLLPNLTFLNLEFNHLHKLPEEMKHLSYTKIYLEGNNFVCDDCDLVNILETVVHIIGQKITCAKQQKLSSESFKCYIKFSVVPYTGLGLFLLIFLIGCYTISKGLYMKLLRKTYEQKTVIICSKDVLRRYVTECKILREIEHRNIRKMHTNISTWIPPVKRFGYLFLEKVDYTLSEVIRGTIDLTFPMDAPSLTKDLISAVHYLHSRKHPIYHGRLCPQTVYLQNDILNKTLHIKIGDFGQAKVFVPTDTADEHTPLISSMNEGNEFMREDLQAVAKIIFSLFTKKERYETITMEDIMDWSDVEFGILILALQNGMIVAEVLQSAPYHSAEQKKSILGELNGHLKWIKSNNKLAAILSEAEENACLVIGGKGAWNKHFEPTVMEEFALNFNGYDITSFVDLLRIIRNILEHGHEQPNSMLAAFETLKPTPAQIFQKFSKKFPLFYLHSLYCFYRFFEERNALSKTYMVTYKKFEDFMCRRGLDERSLLSLQDSSHVYIHYKSVFDTIEKIITGKNVRSCMSVNDMLPEITKTIRELWPEISVTEVLFKYGKKIFPNPLIGGATASGSNSNSDSDSDSDSDNVAKNKVKIPEGSTLEILKPEIRVQLPTKTATLKFRRTDNIKAIKGFGLRNLDPAQRKKVKPDEIIVTLNGRHLKANERLVDLDFTNITLIVGYPLIEV